MAKDWAEWKSEEVENLKKITQLKNNGHPHHCACRQVWGDGECECDMYAKGYDPYAWMRGDYETRTETETDSD